MNTQFSLERAQRILKDLQEMLVPARVPVTRYRIWDGRREDGAVCSTDDWTDWEAGTPWSGLERHRWFRTTVKIPAEFAGCAVEFVLITGREGQWDATNPQMLFYLDGKPVQGVDVNHTRVLLSSCAEAGQRYEIAFLAFSGSVPGDLLLRTELAVLDRRTEAYWYDLKLPVDAAALLAGRDPDNCRRILEVVERSLDRVDLRNPGSEAFYRSLDEAGTVLRDAFYTAPNPGVPTVSAIGHTHIDIAWLWTVEQTREKAVRSFSTVLRLMEQYPDYRFMSSQPILYQFVKEQQPELYEEIKRRVAEGRWEVDGAMWLEADCNLPAGESLVRQILKGRRFFLNEFGKESRSLWLPDVFGYSAALPQILKKSGIETFMTTKISWNQQNQLPNDTFLWRGLDGTEIFVYMPTTCNAQADTGAVTFSESRNTTTYTGDITPNMALGTFGRFQNKDLTEETLLLFGYGDGGGGPTKEMLESAKRLQYGLPGIPRVVQRPEIDFLAGVREKISGLPEMPTWDGELYFERHRGTYTSAAKNKRNNRKSELLYETLETLSVTAAELGLSYPSEEIQKGWDVILLNQFHDIIPGSSISEVYRTTDQEYAEILEKGRVLLNERLEFLASRAEAEGIAVLLYNPLGFDRNDVAEIPAPEGGPFAWAVSEAERVPVQYTEAGTLLFYAQDVPAAGYRVFRLEKGETVPTLADCGRTFENEFYRAEFREDGALASLIEKESGLDLIPAGDAGNLLMTYEDRPGNWDNWDLDDYYRRKPYPADANSGISISEWGPVRCTLRRTLRFSNSTVTQNIRLYPNLPRIDFDTEADWQDNNLLLKAEFPVAVNATKASFEIQFGNVERETTCNHSWDSAKFETCGHKWADLSDNGAGLSLLNDCKYGYCAKNGRLELSLIKAGCYPNSDADRGAHRFTYSIYPHRGRWQESGTVEQAYRLNIPLYGVPAAGDGSLPESFSMFRCSRENCFLEMAKQAEERDSAILRLYENRNMAVRNTVTAGRPLKAVYECDLMERRLREIPLDGTSFTDFVKPFEIKTYELCFAE